MVSPLLYLVFAFCGSFFMGITAVLLKLADVDDVYFGLIVRALGAAPLVLILALFFEGRQFLFLLQSPVFLIKLSLSAIFLMFADIFIMSILKRKPVGMISPMIGIFPLFTSLMLLITGYIQFDLLILFYTVLVIFGVGLVTYNRSIDHKTGLRVAPFDKEAIVYGLAIAFFLGMNNYMDIIILTDISVLQGLSYTSLKFGMLLLLSTISFFIMGRSLDDWQRFTSNRSSTTYLILAGLCAWFLGSIFVYTAYDKAAPELVNAIIGINPVFAVLTSLVLKMEDMNLQKSSGLLCCVIASIGIINL